MPTLPNILMSLFHLVNGFTLLQVPQLVESLQSEVCVAVAAAQDHTLFLTETYDIFLFTAVSVAAIATRKPRSTVEKKCCHHCAILTSFLDFDIHEDSQL